MCVLFFQLLWLNFYFEIIVDSCAAVKNNTEILYFFLPSFHHCWHTAKLQYNPCSTVQSAAIGIDIHTVHWYSHFPGFTCTYWCVCMHVFSSMQFYHLWFPVPRLGKFLFLSNLLSMPMNEWWILSNIFSVLRSIDIVKFIYVEHVDL